MIPKLPAVIPISDLQRDAVSVLERQRLSGAPTVITERGRETAVLIDIETFRRTESEREILAALAQGEQEVGEGLGYDLDEVMSEADRLLALKET